MDSPGFTRRTALAALALAACSRNRASATHTLLAHAASSLTDVLPRVSLAWTASGGLAMRHHFDASSRIAREIEAGAPGDLVFCADSDWMDSLDRGHHLAPGTRVDLLGNSLVVAVTRDGAFVPRAASDLANPALRRLALAGEAVPAGRYARAALRALGVWDGLAGRVVEGDNVRATLAWVARGEADAAVVYATDVAVEPRVRVAFEFPATSHPPIVYPAAALRESTQLVKAGEFLAFCRGASARAIWERAGFRVLG